MSPSPLTAVPTDDPVITPGNSRRLFTLPAGRLCAGDEIHVDGKRYGVLEKTVVRGLDPKDGRVAVETLVVVLLVFKPEAGDMPMSLLRLPYEQVTAGLADNLTIKEA